MQTQSELECRSYNSLSDVADADETIKSRGREQIIHKLLSVILKHGLEEALGIRLLHKHNTIEPHEMMVANSLSDAKGFALVTQATRADSIARKIVPNSWQLVEQGYVASEFSHVHLVETPDVGPATFPAVFVELAEMIKEFDLRNLLGPCLNYSSFVKSHSLGEGSIFLEETDYRERANIVRYVNREDAMTLTTRQTVWVAKREIMAGAKSPRFTTVCECQCSVLPDSGDHQGTHFHPNPQP